MLKHVQKVMDIKHSHEENWLNMEGVVAVGVGKVKGDAGIIVSVDRNHQIIRNQIPLLIDGIRIDVRHTGSVNVQT